jgi:hypothetical protein
MKVGDIIQINGNWGFATNPIVEVIKLTDALVTLRSYPNSQTGLLSHMNESVHGVEMLEGRYKTIKHHKEA